MTEHLNPFIHFEKKNVPTRKPFVTISYEVGAYGVSVIENLCHYLQKQDKSKENTWKLVDKDLAQRVVNDCGLPISSLKYFSESTTSDLEDSFEYMVGLHPTRFSLIYNMNRVIFRLAEAGYVIIVGRGANIISASLPHGVHIRLIGSIENRVKYFKEFFKLEEKEARQFVLKENHRRSKYFRKYFAKNINEPLLYDSVINTDKLSIQDIVRDVGHIDIYRRWRRVYHKRY